MFLRMTVSFRLFTKASIQFDVAVNGAEALDMVFANDGSGPNDKYWLVVIDNQVRPAGALGWGLGCRAQGHCFPEPLLRRPLTAAVPRSLRPTCRAADSVVGCACGRMLDCQSVCALPAVGERALSARRCPC